MSDFKPGARVGPWRLAEWLGEGGNAEVWRAAEEAEHTVALKILKTRQVGTRPWERFRLEVEFVEGLGRRPGILPIESFYLPERLGKGERAWYAMPVAVALAQALGAEAGLRDVVAAVGEIAVTLAALEAEFDVAHRDLKPDNLYHRDGVATVGDFGLLWRPRQSDLTTAKVPGAFSYTAPELFREDLPDEEIDYHQADVFSLAKTLWALARGQAYAIPGPHQATAGDLRVAAVRPDPHGAALDRLIETATLAPPAARPRMSEFAAELRRWLDLPAPGGAPLPDLSALTAQINEQMQPTVARDAERRRWRALLLASAAEVRSQLAELFDWMSSELPGSHVDVRDGDVRSMAQSYEGFGEGSVLQGEPIAASIDDGAEPLAYRLAFGLVLELNELGQLRVAGAMIRGHQQASAEATEDFEPRSAPVGSVEAEALIGQACTWITSNAPRWLGDYAAAEK